MLVQMSLYYTQIEENSNILGVCFFTLSWSSAENVVYEAFVIVYCGDFLFIYLEYRVFS